MAETTPNREAIATLLSWKCRSSKIPPFFNSERCTEVNSLGKFKTNGLLDKNLLTYPPHILASKTYHCFDDLDLSASEEECSNSTLQSSKGPIAARDRGKTELSHFCLLNLIWNPIFKCQQSIRFLKKQTSSYSAGIDIVQKRQFFWLEKLAPEKWLTLLPRAIAFLPAS